ncbi:hypothetical protein DRJ48_03035 [Candidatus Woesearchaeota archaeon]|nr:MAG: hypothetical protein DRJ48_03035 [Candidatus Woesearchaeota archaeon]
MIYLNIFWALLGLFVVIYYASKLFKISKVASFIDEKGELFFILMGSLLIIAIVTNDPITIAGFRFPVELEWLVSLMAVGFGSWRYYLNPLKKKVYEMDREIGEVRTHVLGMKEDVNLIKKKILNSK